MASVEKRQNSKGAATYIVKWRTPDGKHRTRGGFTTKKAARAYATKVEDARVRGVEFDPAAGKLLFREAAQTWLASRHDLKETTRAAYADALAPTCTDGPAATVKRHKRLAGLRIDAVFGEYPLNKITRDHISDWVSRMSAAGKAPSTVRNAYFLVKQVLGQAVVDGRLDSNPADYVKLPTDHNTGRAASHDDPDQFLTAAQVSALVAATPWPFNVYVHLAAWSGLRAAELAGLQVGDLVLPPTPLNPNARPKPGQVSVERTAVWFAPKDLDDKSPRWKYVTPKTKGSRRRVPLPTATTALLRDYLAMHPRRNEPTAPLFPGVTLIPQKPTGVRAEPVGDNTAARAGVGAAELPARFGPVAHGEVAQPVKPTATQKAHRQASALADLTVGEAAARLRLDWSVPIRHATFYKAVYRPAVLRANRIAAATKDRSALLPAGVSWHALRHTYASLCIAAGRPPLEIARFMGHAKVTTTLAVYAHLFNTDDHAEAMGALDAMAAAPVYAENVVPLWGS
ncbi:tyrosine-type recombinase/integrase [Mycolicibacterium fortuitum]|uniref:tyrosine-type recombinase/integrase n=1 Tax=Mycolicibacterium fortuitum TaxID=1766 RepID=UPI0007EDDB94|nr:tyrosine-type recombinase/integrase [Mycolicibacterium fortuitum]NOQ62532.1 tyrosine-type recombinase/integrase [Mycolicibacterium fortuitum]OBI78162.1 integrase [Mycolicibacterium fortuitum]